MKKIVCIQTFAGYKSREHFCAVAEIWVSNVNNLCNGIAYAGFCFLTTCESLGRKRSTF